MIGALRRRKARGRKLPDMAKEDVAAKEVVQLPRRQDPQRATATVEAVFWVSGRSSNELVQRSRPIKQ